MSIAWFCALKRNSAYLRPTALSATIVLVVLFAALGPAANAQAQVVPQNRAEMALSFAPVVKRSAPAVVNVYSKRVVKRQGLGFLERFFGDQGFPGMPRERVQNSLGSGVLVSADGFIVTNHHVVKGGTDIRVVLHDKREFEAEVVLEDKRTDLTVLKINTGEEGLPFLEFEDSDALEVGDLVLAIGNPFGVGQTVTSGIVSALARTDVGVTDYQFFIQTDAAINPGNSGGALVDLAGRLVGINTAIYSRTGGSIGIGFAIPANMVRVVVDSARIGKTVQRPWLGANLQVVTSDIAESLGFDRPKGALVMELHRVSPLKKAGIRRGDVLMSLDGRNISASQEFTYRFATKRVGGRVEIGYMRDGELRVARIKLEVPPEDPPRDITLLKGANNPFSGAVVANLSPALSDELRLSIFDDGVVIVKLKRGNAVRLGFKAGDVILSIGGVTIKSVDDLKRITSYRHDVWELSIKRGSRVINTSING